MTRHRRKLVPLFNELAAALARSKPDLQDSVCCPLCLTIFQRSDIDGLRIEHIVPSSVGGRAVTLSCFKCNSDDGGKLDSHLGRALTSLDGFEGLGTMAMRMDNPSGRLVGEVRWGSGSKTDPIVFRVARKPSNPTAIDNFAKDMSVQESFQVKLNLGYNPARFTRAAIRIAYLAVFSAFKYEYVFSPGGRSGSNSN